MVPRRLLALWLVVVCWVLAPAPAKAGVEATQDQVSQTDSGAALHIRRTDRSKPGETGAAHAWFVVVAAGWALDEPVGAVFQLHSRVRTDRALTKIVGPSPRGPPQLARATG